MSSNIVYRKPKINKKKKNLKLIERRIKLGYYNNKDIMRTVAEILEKIVIKSERND